MQIDNEIIKILACPKCHGKLIDVNDSQGFGCTACGLFYKIEDDIPNFLIDEAEPLSERYDINE